MNLLQTMKAHNESIEESPHQDGPALSVYLFQASNPQWVLKGNQVSPLRHRQVASFPEMFYLCIHCFRISKMIKQSSKHTHFCYLGQTAHPAPLFLNLLESLNFIYAVKKSESQSLEKLLFMFQ